jgi:hypothetical protein
MIELTYVQAFVLGSIIGAFPVLMVHCYFRGKTDGYQRAFELINKVIEEEKGRSKINVK